jgi:hypothetical protein
VVSVAARPSLFVPAKVVIVPGGRAANAASVPAMGATPAAITNRMRCKPPRRRAMAIISA